MVRLRSFAAALLLAAASASVPTLARDARASTAIALTLEDLVDKSETVVVGLPKSKVSRWEAGRIVTYTTVAIDTAVAGKGKAGESIVVRTYGGVVDGIGQITHGEAVLPLDKPIVLFLRAPASPSKSVPASLSVVGMSQGAYPVEVGKDKVARIVPRPVDLVLVPKPDVKVPAATVSLAGKALPDALTEIRTLWAARAKK